MIKVLYIFEAGTLGGATQSLMDMLNKVKKYVTPLVILQPNSPIISNLKSMGIPYYEINIPVDMVSMENKSGEESIFFNSCQAALKIEDVIDAEKIDIVHINSSVSYAGAIAAMQRNIPIVWHVRELLEEQFGMTFYDLKLRLELYKNTEKIITISDFVHDTYLKKYHIDSLKVYNGIEKERYKCTSLCDKNGKKNFLVAGMITPFKGQGDVVKAVEILLQRNIKNFKVYILGGGDKFYIWAIKKYIMEHALQEYIEVSDFCNDLTRYREKSSFSITASQNEALGRVTIEPMLAGNLVIGAKSGGTIELIGENETRGIFYELGNCEELAQKMEMVIKMSWEDRKKILQRAQMFAEEQFDTDDYIEKIMTVYDECLTNKKSIDKKFLKNLEEKYNRLKKSPDFRISKQDNDTCLSLRKSERAFELATKWIEVKQMGHSLKEYFIRRGISELAVYGIAELGRRFYDELYDSDIKILSIIDRNPGLKNNMIEIENDVEICMKDTVIVVTVAALEKEIITELKDKGYCNAIGLSDVLNEF